MQTAKSSTQAISDNITDGIWKVVDEYFKPSKGSQLIKHQIESFNDFILRKVGQIIEGFNPIEINHNYVPETDTFKHIISIHVENPTFVKPLIYEKDGSTKNMTPNDARLRNFTYSSAMSVNLIITTKSMGEDGEYFVETKKINNVSLGKLPIMVRSNYCILKNQCIEGNECQYDYGGYFIINGNEKVVISQDRISENKTFVFMSNKVSPYSHIAEIRSVQENKLSVPKITTLKMSAKPNQFGRCIRVNIHHIKIDIPVFILFKAFGLANDKEIIKYIVYDLRSDVGQLVASQLMACVEEASNVLCQRDAVEYLAKYLNISGYPKEYLQNRMNRISLVRQVLEKEVLPHVGKDLKKKALYLGFMVRKLMKCFLGICEFDDRDSYINKRVDTPGVLLASIFRQYYGKMVKDLKNMVQKEINTGGWKVSNKLINVINKVNIYKIVKSTTIDSGLKYALSTGNWGIKSNKNKQGVAQVLNRMTYNATLSHLRRVNTPIEKSGKLVQPRKLHATQWGVICPAETPEGAGVGLVKNMALMANITICSNSTNVREIVEEQLGMIPFGEKNGYDVEMFGQCTHVLINGDIIGIHNQPEILCEKLKTMKRSGVINVYTSVVWNIQNNEVSISTEGGRCVRPLLIVENGECRLTTKVIEKLKEGKLTWRELVCGNDEFSSVVEYMDVEETNSSLIAMTYQDLLEGRAKGKHYTHMEIHPSLIMGLVASCIPFSDHNQAPRVAYQSSMAKQAIGVYSSNYRYRYDTMGHVLNYGQKPIVKTNPSVIVNNDNLPSGINAIVAIATYTGFNQEDSVILNKSAVDRGLFTSTYYRTYKELNNKNHSNGEEEFFTKPDTTVVRNIKPYNYSKLDGTGFVPENTPVQGGDVIVGKVMPTKVNNIIHYKDNSMALKATDSGVIDRNGANDKYFTNTNGDGYNFAKVRLRSERVPTIGDKISSRHGQKGTCGILYRQEDMPFTADGLVPDIIMNPHAIPSRMTIGQLMECIMGKACAQLGTYGYATPFNGTTVDELSDILENQCGMERHGNQILYNSRTGEQIHTEIFIGPTFYQRLKHMTQDKVHSRGNNGPIVLMTHQPSDGRSRDGGLRLGEMEIECNWAHGIMQFLKERLMECSDNYRVFVCKKCGLMCNVTPEKNIYQCRNCKNITHFSEVRMPYCMKLLTQEVHTMGIGARFMT
jgi:DNA-directed RNA polymerase II subunit RPB2